MRSPSWFILVVLCLGFALGLALAWVFLPAAGRPTTPRALRADFKDQYREAIAAAYVATGDLDRARARLELLGDEDSVQALTAQAQRALAAGSSFDLAQQLARLASDLQAGASSVPSRTPSLPTAAAPTTAGPAAQGTPSAASTAQVATATIFSTQTSTPSPSPSPSPTPSATPLPSPSAPFRLKARQEACDPAIKPGLLRVTVLDQEARPLPGIELILTSVHGTERFFTGLQPDVSPGYADYTMKGGATYSLQVARLGSPVSGLTPPLCTSPNGQTYLGSLQLTFIAP